ncbi:glycosyl hydrolase family 28-related protein [Bacillus cereus]|uniref:glycosyl hydrolase family 28-related protein n=2 Tax=Bacillus TaxID=1386 RepID=UPI0012444940|nr:glycosyl hydrolase family 28-related protein [Bacillus cereus]
MQKLRLRRIKDNEIGRYFKGDHTLNLSDTENAVNGMYGYFSDSILEQNQHLSSLIDEQKERVDHLVVQGGGDSNPEVIDSRFSSTLNTSFTVMGDRFENLEREIKSRGVNVQWFGAKGDGIADDTEAITNAFKSGQAVFFPRGTYLVKSSKIIRVNSKVIHINGEDMSTTIIKFMNNSGGLEITPEDPKSYLYEVKIRNISIQGNDDSANDCLLSLSNCEQFYFDNLFFQNAKLLMKLSKVNLTHFSRVAFANAGAAMKFDKPCGMLSVKEFNFWNIGNVFEISADITQLNVLDGWFERCTNIIVLNASGISCGNLVFSEVYSLCELTEAHFLYCEPITNVGIENLLISNSRLNYPNVSNYSLILFDKLTSNPSRKIHISFDHTIVIGPYLSTHALVQTNYTLEPWNFSVSVQNIFGVYKKNNILLGNGRLSGLINSLGDNRFFNGIILNEDFTTTKGKLSYDSSNNRPIVDIDGLGNVRRVLLEDDINGIIKSTLRPKAEWYPGTGYWEKGTELFNSNPQPGADRGWVCTSSGTPGVWKSIGKIES